MTILIQYKGFSVSPASRTYNFHVIDAPGESRQFAVLVPSESFRLTQLRFQDGPAICFERLQHEIDAETKELHAEPVLNISTSEIQEYLNRQHPPKARKKERVSGLPFESIPNPVLFDASSNQPANDEDDGMPKAAATAEAAGVELREAQQKEIARLKKRIEEMDAAGNRGG